MKDKYVDLATQVIETYVNEGLVPDLPDDPELIDQQGACFVSIKKNGQLRGCIGTIEPSQDTLAQEIIQNAISASTRDPRFTPIRPDELEDLKISVDILTKPEKIKTLRDLDVKKYGIIVSNGNRRGLLLPDLEGVDSIEDQINIALAKGGISLDEPFYLERFEVERHE